MRILVTGGSGFIGTNYIELLLKSGQAEFINLDNRPPRNAAHKSFWQECDLLDASRLKKIVAGFSPTHVVHLAAKTGLDEKKLSDFAANIEGVTYRNLRPLQKSKNEFRLDFMNNYPQDISEY